jgi:hypothetical protein
VVVTHPFHRLSGQRLRVLREVRSPRGLELVCDDGRRGRVVVRAAWTDRVPREPSARVSVETLAGLAVVMGGVSSRHAGGVR